MLGVPTSSSVETAVSVETTAVEVGDEITAEAGATIASQLSFSGLVAIEVNGQVAFATNALNQACADATITAVPNSAITARMAGVDSTAILTTMIDVDANPLVNQAGRTEIATNARDTLHTWKTAENTPDAIVPSAVANIVLNDLDSLGRTGDTHPALAVVVSAQKNVCRYMANRTLPLLC